MSDAPEKWPRWVRALRLRRAVTFVAVGTIATGLLADATSGWSVATGPPAAGLAGFIWCKAHGDGLRASVGFGVGVLVLTWTAFLGVLAIALIVGGI